MYYSPPPPPAATLLLSLLLPSPSEARALLVYRPKLRRIILLLPPLSSSALGVLGVSGSGVFSFSIVVIALLESLSRELASDAARGLSFKDSDAPFSRRREVLVGGVEATGEEPGRGTLLVYSLDVRLSAYEPDSRFCRLRRTPISVAARDTGRGLKSSSGSSVCARRDRRRDVPERGSCDTFC